MILKKNVGYGDSIIRTVIGSLLVGLGLYYQNFWGLLGLILVVTGAISFCPIYRVLKISTMRSDLEREN